MANSLRKIRAWPATFRGMSAIFKPLPTAGRGIRGAEDGGGQRPAGPRVERPRQRDLGIELDAGPIGIDPNRGPQLLHDRRPPDVVGHQHRGPPWPETWIHSLPCPPCWRRRGPVGGQSASIGRRHQPSVQEVVGPSKSCRQDGCPAGTTYPWSAVCACRRMRDEGWRMKARTVVRRAPRTRGRLVCAFGAGGPWAAAGLGSVSKISSANRL